MDDQDKSQSDFNPDEEIKAKLNSPRKPKRMSLAPELCLPRITESGELPIETVRAKSYGELETRAHESNGDEIGFGDHASESDDEQPDAEELASETSAHSEQVEAIINELDKMVEESPSSESVKKENEEVSFKKSKSVQKVEFKSSQVKRKTSPKHSAINKLVKENSKDILSVLEKIKSFHRTKETTSNKHLNRCPHAKVLKTENGENQDKCLVCEITNATEKFTSLDTNRFLVEILYPHDFYDKYSRSRRKLIGLEQQTVPPVHVPIIKPARVVRKPNPQKQIVFKYSTTFDSQDSNKENAIVNDISPARRRDLVTTNETYQVRSRLFGLGDRDKSTLHSKCGDTNKNSVFVYEDSNSEKPLLKGLKGAIRKENHNKEKLNKQVSQSMYEVNSLGMQFSLPEYNTSLSSRRTSLSQEVTSQSIHSTLTPRHLTMFEGGSNRITPLSRTLNRGITFAGFDNFKTVSPPFTRNVRERTNEVQKDSQGTLPIKFGGKTTMVTDNSSKNQSSLPPIENNSNLPNVFITSGPTL